MKEIYKLNLNYFFVLLVTYYFHNFIYELVENRTQHFGIITIINIQLYIVIFTPYIF